MNLINKKFNIIVSSLTVLSISSTLTIPPKHANSQIRQITPRSTHQPRLTPPSNDLQLYTIDPPKSSFPWGIFALDLAILGMGAAGLALIAIRNNKEDE